MMMQNKFARRYGAAFLGDSAVKRDMQEKREIAEQLLFGNGVDKDEVKAVTLLEDCVARGDADAMLMLAKCCALGRGMKHNAERAEALVIEAAWKGNNEAWCLRKLINDWKEITSLSLKGLR